MCVARHAQITQNKKFAISLQYLKKEVNDKVDLLHAGKHENLLQIDTMILMEMVKHFQSSQNSKFAISRKVDFLHTDKHQSGLEVDFNTLGTKVSNLMSMMKHSQSTQSNKFANLCNKKKLKMEYIFCMQKKLEVSKSWHCF